MRCTAIASIVSVTNSYLLRTVLPPLEGKARKWRFESILPVSRQLPNDGSNLSYRTSFCLHCIDSNWSETKFIGGFAKYSCGTACIIEGWSFREWRVIYEHAYPVPTRSSSSLTNKFVCGTSSLVLSTGIQGYSFKGMIEVNKRIWFEVEGAYTYLQHNSEKTEVECWLATCPEWVLYGKFPAECWKCFLLQYRHLAQWVWVSIVAWTRRSYSGSLSSRLKKTRSHHATERKTERTRWERYSARA